MLMYLVSLFDNFKENKEEKEKAWKETLRSLSTATYAIRLDSGKYIYGSVREES